MPKRDSSVRVRVFVVVITKGTTKFRIHRTLFLRPHLARAAMERLRKRHRGAKVHAIDVLVPLPSEIRDPQVTAQFMYWLSPRRR